MLLRSPCQPRSRFGERDRRRPVDPEIAMTRPSYEGARVHLHVQVAGEAAGFTAANVSVVIHEFKMFTMEVLEHEEFGMRARSDVGVGVVEVLLDAPHGSDLCECLVQLLEQDRLRGGQHTFYNTFQIGQMISVWPVDRRERFDHFDLSRLDVLRESPCSKQDYLHSLGP